MVVKLTVALADFVGSAVLVAVIVTVWLLVIELGAVYSPKADTAPTVGLRVQMTAVFVVPAMLAVNCCVCDVDKVEFDGLTETATGGFKVTEALADLVGSAALVAMTVTVCCAVIEDGAV